MMGIILWVIFGALVGWIASHIVGTSARQGLFSNIVLGIIGAVIGGSVMGFFGQSGITGFNLYSTLVAVFGAVVVIWVGQLVFSTSSGTA